MVYFSGNDSSIIRIEVFYGLFVVYVYDRRNQIFAEVNYGPRKKGMLGKSS